MVVYAVGWALGWLLLWSPRRLPPPRPDGRPAIAVVVPARDEAAALPHLVPAIVAQLRAGDEVLVVDDGSADATADVARSHGAHVVVAPPLPDGWVGKPHACAVGAAATSAPLLVFVDADVRPGAQLLDRLGAALVEEPGAVVSVQPWHDAPRAAEQLTGLANVVALMGSGAFTVAGPRAGATVAFGPVLAVDRADYRRVGGHGAEGVRASLTEDIALARAVGRSRVFSDRRDATFRMYPRGVREAVDGWSRTLAAGVAATPWWVLLAVVGWVASLAGGPFAGWIAYPLSAVQVWVLGRRAGRIGPVVAALYPVLVVALVAVLVGAGWRRVRRRATWKGRIVRA